MLKLGFIFVLTFLFTGCSSFSGEHLSVAYIVLLWIGVALGYTLSCLIWASDDPGHKYTPWWEVGLWFFFTFFGAFLGYVKSFFLFSGFFISVLVPVFAMTIVMLIVRAIRNHKGTSKN